MTDAAEAKPAAPTPKEPQERIVVTEHSRVIGGKTLDYTATCGTVVLRDYDDTGENKDGKSRGDRSRATIFFTAYTLKGAPAPDQRPLTFSFNGGPGSSSVWLHLGILGPQRVATDEMGATPSPPYSLVDNEFSLLEASDLVFIDPVGTGFSRVAEGEKVAEFHEYQRDLDAVGEFIRLYLTRYGRWGSPKYVIGESYGTTRASGLSLHLQQKHDIFLNGVMLVSLAVDLQTLSFEHGNELPYPLFLPTYAATAWYHKALSPALQKRPLAEVITEAEGFANNVYSVALLQGSRLSGGKRARVAAELARFSGLSAEYVLRCDLRPHPFRYFKELLRHRGQTVGRLDTRFPGSRPRRCRRASRSRSDAGEPNRGLCGGHQPGAEGHAQVRLRCALRRARSHLGQVDVEGLCQQVRERRRYAAPRDARQSAHARVRRERLLRSRHAACRGRLHVEPPGLASAPAEERARQLFRVRPHDVHPPAFARADGGRTESVRRIEYCSVLNRGTDPRDTDGRGSGLSQLRCGYLHG